MACEFKRKRILICGGSSLLTYLWCNSVINDYEIILTQNKRNIDYLKIPSIKVFSVAFPNNSDGAIPLSQSVCIFENAP